jgi:hypothetical protein
MVKIQSNTGAHTETPKGRAARQAYGGNLPTNHQDNGPQAAAGGSCCVCQQGPPGPPGTVTIVVHHSSIPLKVLQVAMAVLGLQVLDACVHACAECVCCVYACMHEWPHESIQL